MARTVGTFRPYLLILVARHADWGAQPRASIRLSGEKYPRD
jgi:hypothetical protein